MKNKLILIGFLLYHSGHSQIWIDATPSILTHNEFQHQGLIKNSNIMRPYIIQNNNGFTLQYHGEYYLNNNAPNQENMGNKYFGKGAGSFLSNKIAFNHKYIFFSAEPYILNASNQSVSEPTYPNIYTNQDQVNRISERPGGFKWLNDRPLHGSPKYKESGIREFQLYIKYKKLLAGIANVNRWWGPGIHTSLTMSNNTAGFPHYYLGLSDLGLIFFKNLRFNFNYILGEIGKYETSFYFTGVVATITHQSMNNDLTVGFTRTYVSGGIILPGERQWTIRDAALLPAEGLLLSSKKDLWYTVGKGTDKWDQVMTFLAEGYFKQSNLKVFFEIGFNDHIHNLMELRAHWDVSAAYLYGLRKRGLFGNKNIIFGVEYLDLIQRTFSDHRGTTANWFDEEIYNSNSYKGRRWSAHSGFDSDDFYIYLGYQGSNWTIIPAFNYERHGVVYHFPPEVKIEFRFDIRYKYEDWVLNLYIENEYFENIGFVNSNDNVWLEDPLPNTIRRTNTLIFKVEHMFSWGINNY